jgi:HEAT repeat protein
VILQIGAKHMASPWGTAVVFCQIAACAVAVWLAGGLSDSVAQAQETFLGRSADQWSAALASAEGPRRLQAAWALAQLAGSSSGGPGNQRRFAELVKLVQDRDPSVRYWGVTGLAAFADRLDKGDGRRSGVVNTLQPLLDDKAPGPRIAAAQALGQLGQADKALPVLIAAMSDPQESVRIQAVAALERLGPAARSAEQTLRTATNDPSEYVKRISQRAVLQLAEEKK